MNTNLYNALIRAYNFLVTDEENLNEAEYSLRLASVHNADYKKKYYTPKKINWNLAFWGICFLGIFYIMYLIFILLYNYIRKKSVERYNNQLYKSKEYQKEREIAKRNYKLEMERYKSLKLKQENYYKQNYQLCLGFLPKELRNKKAIDALLRYVKAGYANTIDEAWEYYSTELREMAEWKEELEEKEAQRQRHNESQQRLAEISKNQKDLEYKLEQLAKEAEYQRHMRRR